MNKKSTSINVLFIILFLINLLVVRVNAREPVDECIRYVSIRKLGVCHSQSPDSAIHLALEIPFRKVKKSCQGYLKTDSTGNWSVNNAGEIFGNALRDAFYDSVCINKRELKSRWLDAKVATITVIDCVDYCILQKDIHLDNKFYPGFELINKCFDDVRN